jgi:hypothetical protein
MKGRDLSRYNRNGPAMVMGNSHLVRAVNPKEIPNKREYFLLVKKSVFNRKNSVKTIRHMRWNSAYTTRERDITPGKDEKIKAANNPAFSLIIFLPIPYMEANAIAR